MVRGEFKDKYLAKCFYLVSLFVLGGFLGACNNDMEIISEDESDVIIISPEDYRTVSNDTKELLSCGPVSLIDENGQMSIVYLADEESCVESEFSSSIFVRLSRLNLYDNQATMEFVDIAKPNCTLYGHYTGSSAPYEPNLLKGKDSPIIMYRDGGMGGGYICCNLSSDSSCCSNFRSLTLDGLPMTPHNVQSVYGKYKVTNITDSPVLVFTTRIIQSSDSFYSHLGGYNYNGIIVKSSNGVDWESITVPSSVDGLSYILEGALGEDNTTGNYFLCARGNNMVLYRFNHFFNEISKPRFLSEASLSKPTFFNYHNSLYLIVNAQNDNEFSIGRRNTALIYRVDGQTGELTLSKTLKCKDGCAYHSVQVIGDEIWMVFQTDARHIALETQGRSNLALYKFELN